MSISGFLKVIHAPKTPKRGFFQVPQKLTSSIALFKSWQSGLPINLRKMGVSIRFIGSPDCKDLKNAMEEVNFWSTWFTPLLGFFLCVNQVPQKLTSFIAVFKSLQSKLPIILINTPMLRVKCLKEENSEKKNFEKKNWGDFFSQNFLPLDN